jgi:hypothetical protein
MAIGTALAAAAAACGTVAGPGQAGVTAVAAQAGTISETGSSLLLNVISRSGNASFQDDFVATSKLIGPGQGTWLGDAAAAQESDGQGPSLVAAAGRDATSWYAANARVYELGTAANYAGERNLVVGSASGNTLTGYNALELDIPRAIAADQAVFASGASGGANALDPLTGVVIATSLLMAAGCAWAVSRRLAEYR